METINSYANVMKYLHNPSVRDIELVKGVLLLNNRGPLNQRKLTYL
jgi:hypothetical protein